MADELAPDAITQWTEKRKEVLAGLDENDRNLARVMRFTMLIEIEKLKEWLQTKQASSISNVDSPVLVELAYILKYSGEVILYVS
jgi:hypothetical protein